MMRSERLDPRSHEPASQEDVAATHCSNALISIAKNAQWEGCPNDQDAIVICRRPDDSPANKRFMRSNDGTIQKCAAANAQHYDAIQVSAPDQRAMLRILEIVGNDPSACLIVGRFTDVPIIAQGPVSGFFSVLSGREIASRGGTDEGWNLSGDATGKTRPYIARNKRNMRPSSWLLIDRDFTDDQPEALTFHDVEEWWEAMQKFAPGLKGTGRIDLPSSSSRLLDGNDDPIFESPSSHHFVQLKDANDLRRLGTAMLAQAMLCDIGFRRNWGAATRAWTIYDPTTFSWERLSFDGAPVTTVVGTRIAPPSVRIGIEGGRFDSSTVETPASKQAVELREKHQLTIRRNDDGINLMANGLRIDTMVDDAALKLNTLMETELALGSDATLQTVWFELINIGEQKVRAQAPCRPSSSWAAFVRLTETGLPFVYDVGPHVRFNINLEERVGPPVLEFMAKYLAAKDAYLASSHDRQGHFGVNEAVKRWAIATSQAIGRWDARGAKVEDEFEQLVVETEGIIHGGRRERRKYLGDWRTASKTELQTDDVIGNSGLPRINEAIEQANQEFGVTLFGNVAVVVHERVDDLGNFSPQFTKPNEMRTVMQNSFALSTDKPPKLVEAFPAWMSAQSRNTFDRVTFQPEVSFRTNTRKLQQGGEYNAWQGYAVSPIDPTVDPKAKAALDVIINHLSTVMADGNEEKLKYLLDWCATAIQQPERTNMPLLVFKSEEEGVGKGILVDNLLMKIFGVHGMIIDSPDALTGRFNSHLGWCVLVSINEAVWGGDRQRAGKYKAMITDQYRPLEQKFRDIVMVRNFVKGIISTNEDWFAPVGLTDRRHAIFDCSPIKKGDKEYFASVARAINEDGGRAAFLHAMLNRKIDADRMREPPNWQSKARELVTFRSTDSVTSWIYEWLMAGEIVCSDRSIAAIYDDKNSTATIIAEREDATQQVMMFLDEHDPVEFPKSLVFDAYCTWCQAHRKFEAPATASVFWRKIKDVLGSRTKDTRPRTSETNSARQTRNRHRKFAALPDLREQFDQKTGHRICWPEPTDAE